MGKNTTEQNERPNLVTVPNKDLMQRMNFLYQVASYLSQQDGPSLEHIRTHSDQVHNGEGPISKRKRKRPGTVKDLAGFHIRTMRTIGSKSIVKVDPSIKRTLCQVCWSVMLPGQSSTARIEADPSFRFCATSACSNCGWKRTIPTPPQPLQEEQKEDSMVPITRASNAMVSRRWSRASRPMPLFQRDGHVVHVPEKAQKPQQTNEKQDIWVR
ncbi:hypothetical protein FRC15_003460 [Serendipita sp. 397]|nr:hypothetical protein FRC15_003460 [Serendipita sp. 397]